MKDQLYIALDIETTGFDGVLDQVIEIGAVLFDHQKTVATFESMVNPKIKIPPMIQHITGITDDQVKDAPEFETVILKLKEFIKDYIIIGHNIPFDINFLNAKGAQITNTLFDTLELAPILLPKMPSYSLDTLTRLLQIKHQNKHRALSDTIANVDLFKILYQKITELPAKTIENIKLLTAKSSWPLKIIFEDITPSQEPQPTPLQKQNQNNDTPVTKTEFTDFILNNLQTHEKYLVETGPHKNLLQEVIHVAQQFTQKNKTQIIIALKDQKKLDQYKFIFEGQNIAWIKEINKYICLHKLRNFCRKSTFYSYETTLLIKCLLALEKGWDGDITTLPLQNKEFSCLDELACNETCDPKDEANCLYFKALASAKNKPLVIADHKFLTTNSSLEIQNVIILDCNELIKTSFETNQIYITLNVLTKVFERLTEFVKTETDKSPPAITILKLCDTAIKKTQILMSMIGILSSKKLNGQNEDAQVFLDPHHFNLSEWQRVSETAQNLITIIKDCAKKLDLLVSEKTTESITQLKLNLSNTENKILLLLSAPSKIATTSFWTYKSQDNYISLRSSENNLTSLLNEKIYNKYKSIILIDTALKINNSFNFTFSNLGLDPNFKTKSFSTKNYAIENNIKFEESLPDPNSQSYIAKLAEYIVEESVKNKGKTLTIFTSKSTITTVFKIAGPILKTQGFSLIAQFVTGGQGKINSHLKDDPENCVLFATQNFWEEMDLQGTEITLGQIAKIPFIMPFDPLVIIQSKKFINSYSEYQLPSALINFRKSVFNLIEYNPQIKISVLDSRIKTKPYGKDFKNALG